MKTSLMTSLVIAAACAFVPVASAQTQRVRGMIDAVEPASIIVKTATGESVKVMLNGSTKYVSVIKSSLDAVGEGKFIGAATKDEGGRLTALEVVIFPEAMRGTAEGHYGWDEIVDHTAVGSRSTSTMTNGNVTSASSEKRVGSAMTNGNVKMASGSGNKELTVTYQGGEKSITVPQSAPIVAFEQADMSVAKTGTSVFIVAAATSDVLNAGLVAVGKDGVVPPM